MQTQKHAVVSQATTTAEADSWYRGERLTTCTCAPPHVYQFREGRCPEYVKQLESMLREIRSTGFIRNTAHKIRAKIDALLPPNEGA